MRPPYIEWEYAANPAGKALGYDAWDSDRLVAHYVCLPACARVHGVALPVLLSLNTSTHPAYRNRGLFTKLAELTYEAATAKGFAAVYGVANAHSTPGFVRKLGFQLIRPLEVRVRVGSLPAPPANNDVSFERVWRPADLLWRCASPMNAIAYWKNAGQWSFSAHALGALLTAYAQLPEQAVALPPGLQPVRRSVARLFVGLIPGVTHYGRFVSIPSAFRPSPLNFIYRSLQRTASRLDADRAGLSFLDFDAY